MSASPDLALLFPYLSKYNLPHVAAKVNTPGTSAGFGGLAPEEIGRMMSLEKTGFHPEQSHTVVLSTCHGGKNQTSGPQQEIADSSPAAKIVNVLTHQPADGKPRKECP
jgi:hypothetical protein